MIRFQWGELQLTVLQAGSLRLDGGAMFGVVPKVLWSKERAPDEENRIGLAMNLLLVEDGRQATLVDTGAGTHWSPKLRAMYALEVKTPEEILAPAGLAPRQIDRVVNSHLHFDHAGGNTRPDARGGFEATFPDAEYLVQGGELETARSPNERTRASYLADRFEPLAEQGRVRLLDGDAQLAPYLRVFLAPGHTPHMQMVLVVTGEGTVAFPADLLPTSSHVPYPYIMGYDLEPLRTLETKKRVLARAVTEGWRVVFEHDDRMPIGLIVEERGRLRAVEAEI